MAETTKPLTWEELNALYQRQQEGINHRSAAASVRAAVDALNAAIDDAHAAGVQVSFGVSTWTGLRPQKSHVANLRIERASNWKLDDPGEVL